MQGCGVDLFGRRFRMKALLVADLVFLCYPFSKGCDLVTIQAYLLLRKLKRLQHTEENCIWLDDENYRFVNVSEGNQKERYRKFKWIIGNPKSNIDHLVSEGYVIDLGFSYYQLSYIGYHCIQTVLWKAIGSFVKSVLIPLTVSIIASLLVFHFTGSS